MANSTQELLENVRTAEGGCSDYRIGKLLQVTGSTVSLWKNGKGHMNPSHIISACKLAGIRDVGRWQMFIGAEREKGSDGNFFRAMRDDMIRLARGEPLSEDSLLRLFVGGLPKGLGAALIASLLAFTGFAARPAHADDIFELPNNVYYGKRRVRPRGGQRFARQSKARGASLHTS